MAQQTKQFADLLKQGNEYLATHDYESAEEAYTRALAGAKDSRAQAQAWHGKAVALQMLNRYDESLSAYDQAIDLAASAKDAHAQAQAWHGKADALRMLNRYDESLSACDKAIGLAASAKDSRTQAQARLSKADALRMLCCYDEALSACDEAIGLAASAKDVLTQAQAWRGKADALGMLDRYDESLSAADQAIDLAASAKDVLTQAQAWRGKAETLRMLGRYDECLSACDQAIGLASSAKDSLTQVQAWRSKADALRRLNRYDESLRASDQAIDLATSSKDARTQAQTWGSKAMTLRMLDRYVESLSSADQAIDLAASAKDVLTQAQAWRGKAEALRMLNRYDESLSAADQAIDLATSSKDPRTQAQAWHSKAAALISLKHYLEALTCTDYALVQSQMSSAPGYDQANILVSRGEIFEALKRYDEAKSVFAEAGEIGAALGYGYAIVRAQAGLRRLKSVTIKRVRKANAAKATNQPEGDSPTTETFISPSSLDTLKDRAIRTYGPKIASGIAGSEEDQRRVLRSLLPESRAWTVVLICDIRGFTTAFSRTDPEEQLDMLSAYLSRCTDILQEAGGGIDKYMGDAVLAYFLPDDLEQPSPEHKRNTAASALTAACLIAEDSQLCHLFSTYRDRYTDLNDTNFGVGIGIAAGQAKFGEIGSASRREYTLIGRSVNLAARVQAEAKPYEVIATVECWEAYKLDNTAMVFTAMPHKTKETGGMKGFPNDRVVKIVRAS